MSTVPLQSHHLPQSPISEHMSLLERSLYLNHKIYNTSNKALNIPILQSSREHLLHRSYRMRWCIPYNSGRHTLSHNWMPATVIHPSHKNSMLQPRHGKLIHTFEGAGFCLLIYLTIQLSEVHSWHFLSRLTAWHKDLATCHKLCSYYSHWGWDLLIKQTTLLQKDTGNHLLHGKQANQQPPNK